VNFLAHNVSLLDDLCNWFLLKMTIRNPVTTVRQMCTDDVMYLYLADMMQHVLGAYCEI